MLDDDARLLLRASPDLYLLLSPELRIVDASDAYARHLGLDLAAVSGKHVFEVFPGDDESVAEVRSSFATAAALGTPHELPALRFPLHRPDGSIEQRIWRTLNTPVIRDGVLRYILHRAEDITAHKHALDEAKAVSLHYASLFEHAPDAIVIVDQRGQIELVNAQAETVFGYARAELVGQPLELLIPERFRGSHAAHMQRYFAHPGSRPMGTGLKLLGRRKHGGEFPIEVSLSPQPDARGTTVAASIRDITERRSLEEAAALTAERLRSAVESIDDAFALFDRDDRLVLCNSTFRSLIGTNFAGALIGRPYVQILDAWLGAVAFADEAARARFRADRIARHAVEATSTFDVTLTDRRTLRVIDRRTAEGGMVKTILDRTDDEARAEELREARQVAEAASAAKSEFLSSMSHELRTPLNAILGFAQLLERDQKEPPSRRHRERVAHILRGGEHLLRLIDDILDLARIEAGRVAISLEPVDVRELLAEVMRTLEPIAARQQIALALDDRAVPSVHADRTRLAQIAMNLGSNAIKYNRAGGRVDFGLSASDAMVRLTVTDTGHGIPLEQQGKLFQPFQRAGQKTGPIEGTGIGLVITKRLAEMMGGAVGFTSVPGEGSAFWVELPVERSVAAVAAPSDLPPRPPSQAGRHLVLYVEDNPANVRFVEDLAGTLEGIEIASVPNAELGIELARTRRPALVIMDINLPGMSGFDAVRVLRGHPETSAIPVIALTAAANPSDRQRGLELGFARYLTKPVKVDELLDAIEVLVHRGPG